MADQNHKIEIFKFEQTANTREDIRRRYEKYKSKRVRDPRIFDLFMDMEIGERSIPRIPYVQHSSILALGIKSLMAYCIPVFDGNPHLDDKVKGAVWIESGTDVRGVDKSLRDYAIPAGKKFRVIGLYLQYRKDGGSPINKYDLGGFLESGAWSPTWPNLVGAFIAPLPMAPATIIPITGNIDAIIDEINKIVRQYLQSDLVWTDIKVRLPAIVPAPILKPIKLSPAVLQLEKIGDRRVSRYAKSSSIMDVPLDILHSASREQKMSQYDLIMKAQKKLMEQEVQKFRAILHNTYLSNIAQEQFGKELGDLSRAQREKAEAMIATYHVETADPNDPVLYLLRSFRDSFGTSKLAKIWAKVKEIFGESKDGMIAPRDQPERKLLCPHLVERAELELAGGAIEQLVEKWSDPVPVNYSYYCKLCGELIYVDNLEDFNIFGPQTIVSMISDWDPLKTKIFSEVSQVVRQIRFKKSGRNLKSLVSSITESLYPEVIRLQDELQTMKTRSLDDINLLLTLYISVYAYAFFAKMIMDNPDKLEWNVVIKGGGTKQPAVIAVALTLILNTKNTLISRIRDFSSDSIRTIFAQAFQFVSNIKFADTEADDSKIFNDDILRDPIYVFAQTMWILDGKPANATPEEIMKYSVTAKGRQSRLRTAFAQWSEYVTNIQPFKYTVSPVDGVLKTWWEKWADFNRESLAMISKIMPRAQLYRYIRATDELPEVYMSDLHCPDGMRHDFRGGVVFVYGDKKISLSDLMKNGRPEGKLTGMECGRCGHPSSGGSPQDRTAVLATIVEKQILFRYFANRCPSNGLHEFAEDKDGFIGNNECKNCGYRKEFLKTMPADWFQKWKSKIPKRVMTTAEIVAPTLPAKPSPGRDKWSVSLAAILQISKLSNIPYNIWINLGLAEKRSWLQLKSGRINPANDLNEVETRARNVRLTGYVELVRRLYYMVKNHTKILITPQLKQMLDEDPPEVSLSENLPPIFANFNEQLERYSVTNNATELGNFILHSLCQTLINIRNISGKIHKFSTRLFQYLCDQLIRSEMLVSEIEIQKKHLVARAEQQEEDLNEGSADIIKVEETDEADPFSTADVDIENSNTGNDDEDFMD